MSWEQSANIATTLGIIVTLSSIALIYFGKIIKKSFGKKKDDLLEEGLSGFFFLVMYLLIPSLIIYIIFNLTKYINQPTYYSLIGLFLIIIQSLILSIYSPKRQKCKKGYWKFTIKGVILSTISLFITYLFMLKVDFFFGTVSALFNFLILTFIAIKETKYLNVKPA